MRLNDGRMASVVAAGMIIGGLPLWTFALVLINLTVARNAGRPLSGDAIGLAMMSLLAYGLAVLSFAVGAAYFGFKLGRHKLLPKRWHRIVLGLSAFQVVAPLLYFSVV